MFTQKDLTPPIKPMLAGKIPDLKKLTYPLLATPKYDGIRFLGLRQMVSRKLLPLPNQSLQDAWTAFNGKYFGYDGEVCLDNPVAPFNQVSSAVMKKTGNPSFTLYIFDCLVRPHLPFTKRFIELYKTNVLEPNTRGPLRVKIVIPVVVRSESELLTLHCSYIEQGYEGTMLRKPDGIYKYGRSTFNQGYLLKLKDFKDAEAIIVGFEESQTNTNLLTTDHLGAAKRSHKKAGMVNTGSLGKFICESPEWGQFRVGTGRGLTHALRQEIWNNRELYLGKTIKYRYQEMGSVDSPRIPIWLGFRDPIDT